jgi:hypothetical protein
MNMEALESLIDSLDEAERQRVITTYLERLYNEQKSRKRQADRELFEKIQHLQNKYHELPTSAQLFISKYNSQI